MVYIQKTRTIRDVLKWAIAALKEAGIDSPRIDADTLLAFVLACDRARLYTNPDEVLDDNAIDRYERLIHERSGHVPLQYITHHVEFMSLDFTVDERVLIPRQDTEILVETVLKITHDKQYSDKRTIIMDMGTGSGNIAVSLARNLSNVEIYASDISRDALNVAKVNIQKHEVGDKLHLLYGDLFDAFCDHVEKKSVDFVVSNPPYIEESEWKTLQPEIKDHEPREALIGGKDGLCFYRCIIREAPDWLTPEGYLVIEIGETQADAVIELMKNEDRYEDIKVIKDLQGKERVISARRRQQENWMKC